MLMKIAAIFAVTITILAIGCANQPKTRNYLIPSDLQVAQQANELSFESKFINNVITLRGKVDSVEERLSPGLRVTVSDDSHSIDCNTADDQRAVLEALRQGQEIEVSGTLEHSFFGFDLYNCKVTNTMN
jgi:RecG-like helicase